jgi:DNA replication protein DnaC
LRTGRSRPSFYLALKQSFTASSRGTRRSANFGALLDRLTHHVSILEMNGDSYRLGQSRARKAQLRAEARP